jgi:hypothetical protein
MSNKCDIIKDLLPLYADDVCSDESRKAVEEHIKECADCKSELEKLGKNINVSPQKDAEVLKRIKRRLRIEKLVVGLVELVLVLIAGFYLLFYMAGYKSMDYDKHGLSNSISVEEDENGDVYLTYGPVAVDFVTKTAADDNGTILGESGFDHNKKGYGVSFKQRRINIFAPSPEFFFSPDKKVLLFNSRNNPEYEYVFYYDEKDGDKHIVWERDKND